MIYYAKERRLNISEYENAYLSVTEHDFLVTLIINGQVEVENNNATRAMVSRLRKKTGLKIDSFVNYGYVLKSKVYLEEGTNE